MSYEPPDEEPPQPRFPPGLEQDYYPQHGYGQGAYPQQESYPPQGPEPRHHRHKKRHTTRNILGAIGSAVVLIVVIALAVGSRSGGSRNADAEQSAPAAANNAAAATPSSPAPSCAQQVASWDNNGGGTQTSAIGTDLGNVSTAASAFAGDLGSGADPSSNESSLQTAAASLQSDTQTAQSNLPPSCVAGMRENESEGLTDFSKFAGDCEQAISDYNDGDYSAADGDIQVANGVETQGTAKINAAATAIKAFDDANG